ncbi:hypothetical protein ACJMK2_025320 [Sinanodonta woodiana]|uniref:Uncharacterized protein n=1 Tax=Sinanodonta woodiana TaxID=1069815 RepID=A0ABD3XJN9_SINWO
MLKEAIIAVRTESATLGVSHNRSNYADNLSFMNIILNFLPKTRISSQYTNKR